MYIGQIENAAVPPVDPVTATNDGVGAVPPLIPLTLSRMELKLAKRF